MEEKFGYANEVALAAHNAICKYDSDNVDVVEDELTRHLVVMYHSDNNSFPIKDTNLFLDNVDEDSLIDQLDSMGVGHSW